ncbi:acetyl-CoA carboxylase biotin carboxylase subunit [Marivibrio halodurans]|uniref:Acetyl-CoA carboxylase biotin carboxylase subunit n=1 Tax=Marivibrio halodurans TaxID=2039722 RepID=A0A8J7RX70_9PROT|nr:acetyl-CoA carboxylase biotin carboxylase subunit [Marivibrio halodurans]MBP5856190.1 acetyl-CoA carboxylase biotin carboxylase subunit [Marivibrio halodurans]
MKRVLIANRGEIALRIIRACRRAGLETVAVHSSADAASPHVFAADEAVEIGPPSPGQSYLNQAILLDVAERTGADAVHPGYGFLSENAGFARKVADRGLTFIGPSPEVIDRMGDKARAREAAVELGVPVVPGSEGVFHDAASAEAEAGGIGFPLLLKARAGGGGRGMRVAETAEKLPGLFRQAHAEAESAFGDGAIYMERYFSRVRHVEVQVFGDSHGAAAHAWERDCSVQRRHQKLVEEGPSPALSAETREALCEAAVRLTKGVGYVNAGTVEFLYEPDTDKFFFIEMNTRIQVEHPVSEMITGLDLIQEQLRVADGQALSFADGPPPIQGAAVEFRVNAEDPRADFRPTPGRLTAWRPPKGEGLRCDSAVYQDGQISPFYDSMMAKLIVHGSDRADALARAADAIEAFEVEGVSTTLPLYRAMLRDEGFRAGAVDTRWMEREFLPKLLGRAG